MSHNLSGNELVLAIRVADGQYHLDTGVTHDDPWPASDDGLSTGEDGWVGVIAGIDWGHISLVAQVLDGPAPEVDGSWDMAVERDLLVADAGIAVTELYVTGPRTVLDVPAGWWRVRLSVAERGEADTSGTGSSERHLLQVWPVTTGMARQTLCGPDAYAQWYLQPPSGQATTSAERAAFDAVRTLRSLVSQSPPPEFTGAVTTVEVEQVVDAAPDEVFSVFVSLQSWLGMGGRPNYEVGQPFSIQIDRVGGVLRSSGETLAIDPGERIAFTWAWHGRGTTVPARPTTVELVVEAHEGRSIVRVRHSDIPVELARPVRALWEYYLPRLEAHAHGRHPGLHPWVDR